MARRNDGERRHRGRHKGGRRPLEPDADWFDALASGPSPYDQIEIPPAGPERERFFAGLIEHGAPIWRSFREREGAGLVDAGEQILWPTLPGDQVVEFMNSSEG